MSVSRNKNVKTQTLWVLQYFKVLKPCPLALTSEWYYTRAKHLDIVTTFQRTRCTATSVQHVKYRTTRPPWSAAYVTHTHTSSTCLCQGPSNTCGLFKWKTFWRRLIESKPVRLRLDTVCVKRAEQIPYTYADKHVMASTQQWLKQRLATTYILNA